MKVFEEYLSELQTDIVAICLEYVNNQAEDIYMYCSFEPEIFTFDVFYRIDGSVVLKNELNEAVISSKEGYFYDTSDNRQEAVLDIGIRNLEEIYQKCKEHGRDMPAEIKMYYNVKKNSLTAQYNYTQSFSEPDDLLPEERFDMWFEEIKNKIN
nr:DUF600 domain-containing protein [Terribacillus saccharophilus]